MTRPRLLDLFCGAGGAAMGYHRAGFEVVGVDIAPQPHYPFEFHQGDALRWPLDGYNAIHASPPCQAYSTQGRNTRWKNGPHDQHPALIGEVRDRLRATGLPYVIENVSGAKSAMETGIILHGGMFDLGVDRRRRFESNLLLMQPLVGKARQIVGVYGRTHDGRRLTKNREGLRAAHSLEEAQEAMGMGWGDWHGVKEAIPPAYTEYIGAQLLAHLGVMSGS